MFHVPFAQSMPPNQNFLLQPGPCEHLLENSTTGPAYVSNLVPMLASLGSVIPTVAVSNPSSALKIEKSERLLLWCMPERC